MNNTVHFSGNLNKNWRNFQRKNRPNDIPVSSTISHPEDPTQVLKIQKAPVQGMLGDTLDILSHYGTAKTPRKGIFDLARYVRQTLVSKEGEQLDENPSITLEEFREKIGHTQPTAIFTAELNKKLQAYTPEQRAQLKLEPKK